MFVTAGPSTKLCAGRGRRIVEGVRYGISVPCTCPARISRMYRHRPPCFRCCTGNLWRCCSPQVRTNLPGTRSRRSRQSAPSLQSTCRQYSRRKLNCPSWSCTCRASILYTHLRRCLCILEDRHNPSDRRSPQPSVNLACSPGNTPCRRIAFAVQR